MDLREVAASIIEANTFMTVATADEDGNPWASPVWYAPAEHREFYWVSKPGARHSRNLLMRPRVAIVIFDSHEAGGWKSLYASAVAEAVEDVERGIEIFSARSVAQGLPAWTGDDVRSPAKHRLYRATAGEVFVLDPHDERIPVSLERSS
ncbi:MAG TPA: pyridoxamine 5'-phosphate oxidase family protein [Actinomycetota bacterium]|jgi:nitroimidazol reductase NimA-like FMN-containing flavoprotein (pyridoxamine 5'-phosphate oxidase superfamily)